MGRESVVKGGEEEVEFDITERVIEDLVGWDRKGYALRILFGMKEFAQEAENGFRIIHLQRFAALKPERLRKCRTLEDVRNAVNALLREDKEERERGREVHIRTIKRRVDRLIEEGWIRKVSREGHHDAYQLGGILPYLHRKNMDVLKKVWSKFVELLIGDMRPLSPSLGLSISGELGVLPMGIPVRRVFKETIPWQLRDGTNMFAFGNKEDAERNIEKYSLFMNNPEEIPRLLAWRRNVVGSTELTKQQLREMKDLEAVSVIGTPLEMIFRDVFSKYLNRLYPNGWLFIAYNDKAAVSYKKSLKKMTIGTKGHTISMKVKDIEEGTSKTVDLPILISEVQEEE